MEEWKTSNCGRRLASIKEEGLGYFFTSLDFLKNEHLEQGLFIGGRRSTLVAKSEVKMKGKDLRDRIDSAVKEIIRDCDVNKGSEYCAPWLQAVKKDGYASFLRYLNEFCPSDVLYIYTVRDLPQPKNPEKK
jgi:hypothetical protein